MSCFPESGDFPLHTYGPGEQPLIVHFVAFNAKFGALDCARIDLCQMASETLAESLDLDSPAHQRGMAALKCRSESNDLLL
jgi:hypothetical protein